MSTKTFSNFEQWHRYSEKYIEEENLLKYLEITHANIRRIKKHWNELLIHRTEVNIQVDVLILSEIGVNHDMFNTYSLPRYTSFSACRYYRRGGVGLVFVKDNWKSEQIALSFQTVESIAVSISCNHNTFIFWSIYRPPNGIIHDLLKEVEFMLKKFDYTSNLTIAGNLNIDTLNLSKTGVSDYLDIIS